MNSKFELKILQLIEIISIASTPLYLNAEYFSRVVIKYKYILL